MNKTIIAAIAVGTLVLAACGSDDDGGGGGVQGEAAQQAIDAADEVGLELDESCVNDLADKLSDEDAQAIVDEDSDGDPELSAEGEALTESLLDCVSQDALIDLFIEGLGDDANTIDTDCLRNELEELDLAKELEADGTSSALVAAVLECTTG